MARKDWCVTFMRALGLIVGCLATGIAYSMDAFTTYSDALKDIFQYNQSEIELIISLGNVGLLSSLPAGLLIRKCGARVLSFVGLVIGAGSYGLLCLATFNIPYYSKNASLISLYYFFSGVAGGIMYITATTVNVRNFDLKYLGIVSGILHSMKSAVLGVIMATYQAGFSSTAGITPNTSIRDQVSSNLTFEDTTDNTTEFDFTTLTYDINTTTVNGHGEEPGFRHANLGGFFAVISISYAAVNLLGMACYGYYPQEVIEEVQGHVGERQRLISRKRSRRDTGDFEDILSRSSCSIKVVTSLDSEERPGPGPFGLIKSYYYHAILWPSVFLIANRTCYINNLTGFTTAMGVDEYSEGVLLSLVPILGTIVKPVLGVISDALASKVPRSATLLLWLLLEAAASVLCITLFSNVAVITTGLIFVIFGSCTVQTQSPAILVETFGKDCFSFGWGFITLAWSLATLGFQMMYGALYDREVVPGSGNYCYGQHCFTLYFTITGGLAFLTAVVVVYAVVKQFKEIRARIAFDKRHRRCASH